MHHDETSKSKRFKITPRFTHKTLTNFFGTSGILLNLQEKLILINREKIIPEKSFRIFKTFEKVFLENTKTNTRKRRN